MAVALLGAPGCKDREDGPDGLYVYDNRSSSVLVWRDLEQVHDAARDRELFALLPPAAGDSAKTSILVFGAGQFHGSHDQPPSRILPDLPGDLRIIIHAPVSDWMAGAASEPAEDGLGQGRKTLYPWPSSGSGQPPVTVENLPGAGEIRALAIWEG
jgi:hypothetical protein